MSTTAMTEVVELIGTEASQLQDFLAGLALRSGLGPARVPGGR